MNCSACGVPLQGAEVYCSRCGSATTYSYMVGQAAPDDPTFASSQVASIAPPPPRRPAPGSKRTGLIIGVILLIVLLVGGGAWLGYSWVRNAAETGARATVGAQTKATATATPSTFIARSTFKIVKSAVTSVEQDGANKIEKRSIELVFSGDLAGSSRVDETAVISPDNTTTFSGSNVCVCTVAGKSGTLMWSYSGTSAADGSFSGQFFDMHGTGDLAKLHGKGEFQGQGTEGTVTSELYFEP